MIIGMMNDFDAIMRQVYRKRLITVRSLVLVTLLLALSIPAIPVRSAVAAEGVTVETVAEGFSHPWSIAFLPDGDYLVSEKSGSLRRVSPDGAVSEPLAGAPETYFAGQGGFFDVVLDPAFVENQTIYLSFAYGTAEANGTRIVRATLNGNALEEVEPIFTVSPLKDTPAHYGGKLAFLPDGTLLLTTGDGFNFREAPMDPFSQLGKTIRINTDGSIPPDNPFADGVEANPAVYTLGHRNPQGLVVDAAGNAWLHEHGPQGGDEVNLLKPGANYGWPATSYGINYSGALVTPFQTAPGIEPPVTHWTPSIAPSGMAYYAGDKFPEWQGDLFVGALVDQDVKRLDMDGTTLVGEIAILPEVNARIRDVRFGPDGFMYLLTDREGGKILRVRPRD